MDDVLYSAFSDLSTGAGLCALLSAAARSPGLGPVVAGALLGVFLGVVDRLRNALKDARSVFAVALSARQFFAVWEARDSDDGAGLVAIPLFFLVCAMPVGNTSEYFRHARAVGSGLGVALLGGAAVYYYTTDARHAPPGDSPFTDLDPSAPLSQLLAVVDLAYASAQPPWQSEHPVWVAAGRAAAFALLSQAPGFLRFVLGGPHPLWLVALYSAVLVQSAQVHACHVRLQLTGSDPQRVLMLLMVTALASGYSERSGDVANVSFAALAVIAASAFAVVIRKKVYGRDD